tara:strand:- start:19 stop:1149 length:1131 start_codon:yes stop_codon:yes gene_type:complete
VAIQQLLREWPPGYGGVERVAHELGNSCGGVIFSLDVQRQASFCHDSLQVTYPRRYLRSIAVFGRLHVPLPSRSLILLLISSEPLHGHLPSPAVLLLLLLARLLRPRRIVTAHWHCFLEPTLGLNGCLFSLYQWIAIKVLPCMSSVVTTSPVMSAELQRCSCSPAQLVVLPCCLSASQERAALAIPLPVVQEAQLMRVLFIGRLDSYKRLDWLLESLAAIRSPWRLSVVGDGPHRSRFEHLARQLFFDPLRADPKLVHFHGRLNETQKQEKIADSDVLVLPSDRSNEAFGIVQLEAMAAGRIALAFDKPRSGMGWVGRLPGLPWSQAPDGLVEVLQRLADQPALRQELSAQSRERYRTLFARRVWLRQLEQLGYPS